MLETKRVGFIGGGQMAYAVAMGIVKGGLVDPSYIYVSNRSKEKLTMFSQKGIHVTQDNMLVLSTCDIVFLSIKPQVFPTIVDEITAKRGPGAKFPDKLFVSVMAAITLETMHKALGVDTKIVRTTPNTPCLVGAGTIVMCTSETVTDDEAAEVESLLSSCGKCFHCAEKLMDTASSLMGCSCAYFFVAIEALADGGVMHGIPRALALKLASNAVMGAGKLALESSKHPGELKDGVSSPGGTTIRGLYALEKAGFRSALIDAVNDTTLHAKELAKKQ